MKGRVIVISNKGAAEIENGRLLDLILNPSVVDPTPRFGETFTAKVDRLVPGAGAAFVRLTPHHSGFLRDAKALRSGQEIVVQVQGFAEPGKAIPVTSRISVRGPRLLLTPSAPGVNVSRAIKDRDEADRLKQSVSDGQIEEDFHLCVPSKDRDDYLSTGGVVVRTAAKDADARELSMEFRVLLGSLRRLGQPGPRPDAEVYAWTEWSIPTPDVVALTDDLEPMWEPPFAVEDLDRVVRFGDGDPFDHFGIWGEIEQLKSPRADLPSGGWMAMEATRAMVTIDVNTGDGFGAGDAMTANIEAARELPRQLRLRGLGGQMILDFAPLKKQHRKKIEEELKRAFRKDPIDTTLAGWTPLGNFELQRKRERRPLSELLA